MDRSLIQQHTSAIIKGFIAEAEAVGGLHHKSQMGRLRELFVSKILSRFLTSQFGIGTGVIINQNREQSKQIDIIIYDNRILPPFVEEQKVGVYPAECVLGVIEVRSWISKEIIEKYAEAARILYEEIYHPSHSSLYKDFANMKPFYSLVGFHNKGISKDMNEKNILEWMNNNAQPMFGVCLVNGFSWLNLRPKGSLKMFDKHNEETKAFVAVLLDNIRTISEKRYLSLASHKDWLGIYMRDQGGIKEALERGEKIPEY